MNLQVKTMWRHLFLLLCLAALLCAGCAKMGEVAGKTVRGVENAASDFRHGYNKGKAE